MNNTRKADKSIRLWDYYFYKKNDDIKAIKNYKKAIKLRYEFDEKLFYKISVSYKYLRDLNEALKYINISLKCSPSYFDALKFKWEILKKMWKDEESNECINKANTLNEKFENKEVDLEEIYRSGKW